MPRVAPTALGPGDAGAAPLVAGRRQKHGAQWSTVAGLLYVLISTAATIGGLFAMADYLANDFIWFQFGSTALALTNVINLQLPHVTNRTTLDLFAPSSGLSKHDAVGISDAYTRFLRYEALTTLHDAVAGLRNLHLLRVATMGAQYCWVDWDRRWAMAHTVARQERCRDRYATNGAVYLESVLRNIDFNAWVDVTQGLFTQRIGNGVTESSDDGPGFLKYLTTHQILDLDSEVHIWSNAGLAHFVMQYTNAYQIGLYDVVRIESALGQVIAFKIKDIPVASRGVRWTTNYMYGGLQTDLNIPSGNQSLVQNSSTFVGDVSPGLLEAVLVCWPLPAAFQAVHNDIGPLDNIDVLWVPVPGAVLSIVQTFRSLLLARLASDAAMAPALDAIGTVELHPTPLKWHDPTLLFYGGNPTCGFGVGLAFVQESFGFDDSCGTQKALTYTLSPLASLFAWTMLGDANATASICALMPAAEIHGCATALHTIQAAATLVPSLSELRLPTSSLPPLQLMQFVGRNASPPVVETQLLLDPSFAFFGWVSVYEWVMHTREVVTFEGDVASCTLMTSAATHKALPPYALRSSFGTYLWYCCVAVTVVLVSLAMLLVCLWMCYYRPSHTPWLQWSHVVSATWLNRGLLMARGGAALLCLSSAVPQSEATAFGSQFAPRRQRSLVASCLLSSEATWILYVLHEAFHPLTAPYTSSYARWSLVSGWLYLLLLDVAAPVHVSVTLERSCTSQNMDRVLYCTSGHIVIGHLDRVYANLAGLVAAACGSYLVARRWTSLGEVAETPSLLLNSAAIAFLGRKEQAHVNVVTAAMVGVLHFPRRGILFDTKLWVFVQTNTVPVSLLGLPSTPGPKISVVREDLHRLSNMAPSSTTYSFLQLRVKQMILLCGILYTMFSLTSNVAFLTVAQTFLANDFGWAGFNSTGMHAFLANAINQHLLISTNTTLDLTSTALADISQLYNGSVASIAWSAHAPRRQLMDASVPLTRFVQGLRDMNPCMLPWMFTQYCWLDLDRHWAMASTTRRQARLALWRRYNLTRFQLQWQNYKTIGMVDTFSITSALGYTSSLTLSRSDASFHLLQQTSNRMYWAFASDLWAIATNTSLIGGYSLLASSPRFAFTNVSSQAVLFQNLTLPQPLTPGLIVLQATIGPFGAVDMHYVAPPASAVAVYAAFFASFNTLMALDHVAQATVLSVPARSRVCAVPPALLINPLTQVSGGGFMCGNDVPLEPASYGLLNSFGEANACHALFLETLLPSTAELFFALLAFNASHGPMVSADASALCRLDACAGATCAPTLNTLVAFLEEHMNDSFSSLTPLFQASVADLLALDIQTTQYYSHTTDTDTQLYQINLLEPSERLWTFYGWLFLFEWLNGGREVVSFQGDAGSITTIATAYPALAQTPDPYEVPTSVSLVVLGSTVYITSILIGVTCILAVYILGTRGVGMEANNLFELNRVVGHVWAGRSFILLRSVTAIWMLNTAPLLLTQVGHATHFTSPQLPWYQTILAASEVTWLVYALNDIGSCVTLQYTTAYAYKSSLATWFILVVWSFVAPLSYSATLHRHCTFVDMDAGLLCSSASIHIGSTSGVLGVVVVALSCICVWFGWDRWRLRGLAPPGVHSLLLNAHCVYMLDFTNWKYKGEYYLDKTSAVLAGLLSLEYHGKLYIFDIKTWRLFSCASSKDPTQPERFQVAIPLSQL
ncbi:hypothetical protein SPRG_19680 [Saprolegnia parasitica CBS 223.65]|uniref:Uncharacterized protein n=1 Tax=Saprolegnia parasitica (strain CBS 223.65) TaxID=695850 RepID=A0A067CNS6_SAPPC|nr:hypothetical protein SPRG_19680 [Saprolegnia parasitica CBS 223.65]KDO30895.1 hypothetical protein SPRG_19680 [Saprolegnia parasitica CBS 223.65]|eukprot:XP_012198631.1 hypothetical protein SPRG_19680 [Saprolegnia parasitica CBS 223.65]